MIRRLGADISNWTSLDQRQADWLHGLLDFVCIGLQDQYKARDFRDMINGDGVDAPEFQSYSDQPGRNMDSCRPGEWNWVDLEKGPFFKTPEEVRAQGTFNTSLGLKTAIYTNPAGFIPIFGLSTELADYGCPLIYADYRSPLWNTFVPFNGWDRPAAWQCSSMGLHLPQGFGFTDINCDLLVAPAL